MSSKISKSNRYAQLDRSPNVNDIGEGSTRSSSARIEYDSIERQLLFWPIEKPGHPRHPFNISRWLEYSALCEPFCDALTIRSSGKSIAYVDKSIAHLRPFLDYLDTISNRALKLSELDQTIVNGYIVWLNQITDTGLV